MNLLLIFFSFVFGSGATFLVSYLVTLLFSDTYGAQYIMLVAIVNLMVSFSNFGISPLIVKEASGSDGKINYFAYSKVLFLFGSLGLVAYFIFVYSQGINYFLALSFFLSAVTYYIFDLVMSCALSKRNYLDVSKIQIITPMSRLLPLLVQPFLGDEWSIGLLGILSFLWVFIALRFSEKYCVYSCEESNGGLGIIKKSAPFGLNNFFYVSYSNVFIFLAGLYCTNNEVILLGACFVFINSFNLLPNIVFQRYLQPIYYARYKENIFLLKLMVRKHLLISFFVGSSFYLFMYFFSDFIVSAIYFNKFPLLADMLKVCLVYIPFRYIALNVECIINTTLYLKYKPVIQLCSFVVAVLSFFVLSHGFKDLEAIIYSFLISECVFLLGYIFMFLKCDLSR